MLICGRYEGVDERVGEQLAAEDSPLAISSFPGENCRGNDPRRGDTADSWGSGRWSFPSERILQRNGRWGMQWPPRTRLSIHTSPDTISVLHSLLDFPHYTRPPSFRGWSVPEVLLGGNHEEIRRWRRSEGNLEDMAQSPRRLRWRFRLAALYPQASAVKDPFPPIWRYDSFA